MERKTTAKETSYFTGSSLLGSFFITNQTGMCVFLKRILRDSWRWERKKEPGTGWHYGLETLVPTVIKMMRDCDSFEFTSSFFFLSLLFSFLSSFLSSSFPSLKLALHHQQLHHLPSLFVSCKTISLFLSLWPKERLHKPLTWRRREKRIAWETEERLVLLHRQQQHHTVHPLRFFIAFKIVMNLRVKREEVPLPLSSSSRGRREERVTHSVASGNESSTLLFSLPSHFSHRHTFFILMEEEKNNCGLWFNG